MIKPGANLSLKGLKPNVTSSEESKFLYLILQELQQLRSSSRSQEFYTFLVGTTADAPVNGQSSWTPKTISFYNKSVALLIDGVPTAFTVTGNTLTLITGTFATSTQVTISY